MTSKAASLTDTPLLQFLKNRGMACLKQKFEIHNLHLQALFLNLKYKSLIPISEAKRQGIQRLAKDLLCTQPCDSMKSVICISEDSIGASTCGVSVEHSYSHDHQERTRLIASNLDNEFLEWEDSATDN